MPTPAKSRIERAVVPVMIFAVVTGLVGVALDIYQDLSGVGERVLPLSSLGPVAGVLVVWATQRRSLEGLLPAAVSPRQVIAHLVLGVVASVVLIAVMLGVLAAMGSAPVWPRGMGLLPADVDGIPFLVTAVGVIAAAAMTEIGLRGLAQPLLELAGSRLLAALIVGVAWGFWVVQLYPVQNTPVAIAAMIVGVIALGVLLGYLGNGSVGQRLAVTIVAHAIVAVAFAFIGGGGETSETVAVAFFVAAAVTTVAFMLMFVAAQRKRAKRRAAVQ